LEIIDLLRKINLKDLFNRANRTEDTKPVEEETPTEEIPEEPEVQEIEKKVDVASLDAGTITRTVVLVLTLVNAVLSITGKDKIAFTDDQVYQVVSAILTVIVPIWTWWENNAFTRNARKAEKYRKDLNKKDATHGSGANE